MTDGHSEPRDGMAAEGRSVNRTQWNKHKITKQREQVNFPTDDCGNEDP